MLLLSTPRLEISGNFAFMEGKLIKDLKYYTIEEVWRKYIPEAKGIAKTAYSVTTISYNSRNFNIFVIPYMEIGNYFTKTIPHKANYTEYFQVLWGNPMFEIWKEQKDGTFTVKKGAKKPVETIALEKDEYITAFNSSTEKAIILSYTSGILEDEKATEPIIFGPNMNTMNDRMLVKKQEKIENENINLVALLEKACKNILEKK